MIEEPDEGRLRARLEQFRRDARVPGVAVSVHTTARQLDVAVGHRDTGAREALASDASFELGCAVKPLLAAAAVRLAGLGRLGLEDPIADHLPEFGACRYGREVRLLHVLSHTSGYLGSGLAEGPNGLAWSALVDRLAAAPRLFRPGAVFSYEHSETVLLGRALTAGADAPLDAVVAALVLAPAGVAADAGASAGRHGIDPAGRPVRIARPLGREEFWQPGFALALSMPSLARAAAGLLTGERRGVLAAMLEPAIALPPMLAGPACPELPVGYGRGIARFRGGWVGANGIGAGQSVALRLHPAHGLAVAVGLNVLAPGLRDALVAAICGECLPRHGAGARPGFDAPLEAFAGDYVGGGDGFVKARVANGTLELEIGARQGPRRLHARIARRGQHLGLEAEVPHLAVGLGRVEGEEPWLMLGLSAFGRRPISTPKNEIPAFRDPAG